MRTRIHTVRRTIGRWETIAIVLLLALLVTVEAQAAITVTRTSGSQFYTDTSITSPGVPKCGYVSFDISSSSAISDAWATIGGFSGGYFSLGGGDDGLVHFGPLGAGQTRPAFYYLCSSYTTSNLSPAQTYDLKVYNGNPTTGGIQQGTASTFSTIINNGVIQANANQVNVIVSGPNPSIVGGIITMTIDGDSGTIGCSNPPSTCSGSSGGPMAFTPAAFSSWRADAYEMVGSNINLSGGNSGSYDNVLYIDNVADSKDTHYIASFYFRAVGTTGASTTLSPVSYLASGTQVKHTSLSSGAYNPGGGGLPPIQSAQAAIVLTKTVSHATLTAQGGRVTYTVNAVNSGLDGTTLDSFNDLLPVGATYVSGSTSFNGAAFADPVTSGQNLTWSSIFTIPAGSTRTLIFQADLPASPGTYTNSVAARIGTIVIDSTLQTTDNLPATATTLVLAPPVIAKAFSPTALVVNGTATLTLTITNPNASQTLNGIAVSDTLPSSPAGLGFAVPTGAATTCPGAALTVAGSTIAITGGSLAAGQSCTVTAHVTSTSANTSYTNTTGIVSSTNGGTGTTASATVTFTDKPTISKTFSLSSIPKNGTAALTIVITNNSIVPLSGLTFDDLFPAGLVTANPPAVTPAAPCGGTLSSWNGTTAAVLDPTGGNPGIRLTGGSIAAPGGTCSFAVNVSAATAGVYPNTTGGANSNETSPAGPGSNTATLTVLSPPAVAKTFSPATIGKGQTSTVTVTLTNPNGVDITGAAFTDTFPANLSTATTPNLSTTCPGGSLSSTASSFSLSGGTVPAGGSCTASVDVTSSLANSYTNTLGSGAITTVNAGSNSSAASATLIVNATPAISKSFTFNPATGVTTMSITILNNHTAAISGLSFTDLFPPGMFTADTPSVTPAVPCGAGSSLQSWNGTTPGTLSSTGGDLGIRLNAGQITTAGGSCTFSINLVVNSLGVYANQTSGVTLTAPFSGTGSPSNSATLIAPAISKSFTPNIVGPGDISRLEIRVTNPSLTTNLTGLSLTDTYPTTATLPSGATLAAAITNSASPNATSNCGGTLTATPNGTDITLTGGSLAAGGACTISVNVRAVNASPAAYYNTTARVASDQGIGFTGSDALYTVTKTTVTKSFLTSPVTLSGGTANSVVRIIVENNAGADITAVSFTDAFPSSPSQMRWVNTVANSCGGSLTDAAGAALVSGTSTGIKLTNGAITATAVTCTIDVTVSVFATGTYYNTTSGATSSANASPGPTSNAAALTAYLSVPTATKTFADNALQTGNSIRMTITLTNPSATAITGVAFTDSYPANLFNAAVPNLVSSCVGTSTAAPGSGSLSLSGGTIPASGSCTLAVGLTTAIAGSYSNSINANSITSTNANTGPAAAVTATVAAYQPPTLTKSFSPATIASGGSSVLTLTLGNPAANPTAISGLIVDDSFPAGLTLKDSTFTFTPAACGSISSTSGAPAAAGDNNIRFTAAAMAPGTTCQAAVNVTSSTSGISANTTGTVTATGPVSLTGLTATASLTVTLGDTTLTILKTANAATAKPGDTITYTLLITNTGSAPAGNISVADVLSPYIVFGTDSYPAAPVPPGPAFDFFGSGSLPTPNSPQYFDKDNNSITPSGAYDGTVARWNITFSGTLGNGSSFTVRYKTQVK